MHERMNKYDKAETQRVGQFQRVMKFTKINERNKIGTVLNWKEKKMKTECKLVVLSFYFYGPSNGITINTNIVHSP